MRFIPIVISLFIVAMVSGCGGGGSGNGGGNNSGTPITSTLSFPLQSALRSFFQNGSGLSQSYTVTGSCMESGTDSFTTASTPAVFEGVAGFSYTHTGTVSTSNCAAAPSTYTETIFLDSNYDVLGTSGTGYYTVGSEAYPVTARVGDTGTIGTATHYTSSTKATSTGYSMRSYIIEPDTATTILLNRIKRTYNTSGVLVSTTQIRFRITATGSVKLVSGDYVSGGTHLITTYY